VAFGRYAALAEQNDFTVSKTIVIEEHERCLIQVARFSVASSREEQAHFMGPPVMPLDVPC
jgi:hypothetical protein